MLEECRPAADYVMAHTSRFHERTVQDVKPEQLLKTCCRCGRRFLKWQMAHVGDETYKCVQCLGIA